MSWVFCRWFFCLNLVAGWKIHHLKMHFPLKNPPMEAKIPTQIGQENHRNLHFQVACYFSGGRFEYLIGSLGFIDVYWNFHPRKVDAKLILVDTSTKICFSLLQVSFVVDHVDGLWSRRCYGHSSGRSYDHGLLEGPEKRLEFFFQLELASAKWWWTAWWFGAVGDLDSIIRIPENDWKGLGFLRTRKNLASFFQEEST